MALYMSALWLNRHRTSSWLLHTTPISYRLHGMTFRSLNSNNTQSIVASPRLLAESARGTQDEICEADLYRYTRQRWLKNEQQELAKRYVKFNVPGFIEKAIDACKGARYCTQIVKCVEGLHNKAFVLTMDNGSEVFAKLPNPNAGPANYTTASEVATRQILREVFNLPVPRVLAWSCDATTNSVQAEYIIEEKVPGVKLGMVWPELPWAVKLAIVDQIVDIDHSLSAVNFDKHGCIYLKKDLQRLTGESSAIHLDKNQSRLTLEQYAMGPLTKAELWVSGRREAPIDRGPWTDSEAYVRALGTGEASWIRSNAKPRMNYYRSLKDPELPEDALALIAKYEKIASFLVPSPECRSATKNTLWHPDLHLDNVFVDPSTHKITGIIDWQSAAVAPMFYQSGVHRAFRHYKSVQAGWVIPEKPANYDNLPVDEQKKIDKDLESETLHKYYELQTMKAAPLHFDVLQQGSVPMLRKPVWLVTGAWENKDLFFLRDCLITLVAKWNDIFGEDTPCPIMFSKQELELHAKEEENMDGVGQMLSLLQQQGVLPADGMVQPEDYETALENCQKYKDIFVNSADDETERQLYSKLWPYQEDSDEMSPTQ